MTYKSLCICLKVMLIACFLLLLQPAHAQYNWSALDKDLEAKQAMLGKDLVAMVWTGDSLVFKKEMGEFNSKTISDYSAFFTNTTLFRSVL